MTNLPMLNPLLVIPARLGSTRLPNKVLAQISGKTMISHVYERCVASQLGPVLVACDSPAVAEEIKKLGGQTCLTDPDLPSGSDRVYHAVEQIDPQGEFDVVICVQADLPNIDPSLIHKSLLPLQYPEVDIATLATTMLDKDDVNNPNVVKIVLSNHEYKVDKPCQDVSIYQALYFSRSPIPHGGDPYYHHIGLYAYRRRALQRFITLSPSPLERQEKLEQLRALEDGMHISVAIVDTLPIGVDTPDDLAKARDYYSRM